MISGIVLLVLYGCRDETDSLYRGEDRKETPVCFTAKWPQDSFGTTRAITDKKEFKNGDRICFRLGYFAVMRAFTSKYVEKIYEKQEIEKEKNESLYKVS